MFTNIGPALSPVTGCSNSSCLLGRAKLLSTATCGSPLLFSPLLVQYISTGGITKCSAKVALTESFVSAVQLDNCTSGHLFMWHVAKSAWLGLSRILMPSSEECGITNPVCNTRCNVWPLLQIYSVFICLTFMLPFLLVPKNSL